MDIRNAGSEVLQTSPAQANSGGHEDIELGRNDATHAPRKKKRPWRGRARKDTILKDMIQKESTTDKIESHIREVFSVPVSDIPSGYPLLSAFQSSKPAFSIYRSFDYLHSRVILELQDQLRELEDKLKDLDTLHSTSIAPKQRWRVSSRMRDIAAAKSERNNSHSRLQLGLQDGGEGPQTNNSPDQEQNGSLSQDTVPIERAVLLDQIQHKLVRYDEILVHARRLVEFQRPSNDEWLSFRRWYYNKKPLGSEDEDRFIRMKDDLITLRPRTDSGKIDDWIERVIGKLPEGKATKYFYKHGERGFQDAYTRYFNVARIEALAVLIVAIVIILLLAVPVFIMYRITWMGTRSSTFLNIALLIVFALLFSAAMGLLTKAKRAELFAATAAYCAVLVVFIGNFSSNLTANRT